MAALSDPFLPRPPDSLARGAGLALAVHAALAAALAFGVHWRTRAPEGVSAELWAALPEVAAPAPEPPPPAPAPTPAPPPAPEAAQQQAEAQIAIERERRAKQEREAQERAEQKARDEAERRKREQEQKAAAERQARLRDEQLARLNAALQGTGAPNSGGTAARSAGPSAAYAGLLAAAIRSRITTAGEIPGNPVAQVEVRATEGGTILSRRLVKSSGVPEWDEAVLRAIDRLGALPRNPEGPIPKDVTIDAKPKD